MNFASWPFLAVFLPVTLLGFGLIRGERASYWRQLWLIGASLVFYGVSGPRNLAILVVSMIVNYSAGAWLARNQEAAKARRLLVLWAAIAFNLGLLTTFKWLALSDPARNGFSIAHTILIPLALSFITFQEIGFVAACARGQIRDPKAVDYVFFAVFFPHLVLGPILQFNDIRRQIDSGALARRSTQDLAVGLSIFVFGLTKKVLLADPLSRAVEPVFEAAASGGGPTTPELWFAIAAFQLQLYLDFSAYADMAIGLGRMVGVALPINFDAPLKAQDRFDLWRRWHISFVVFMRTNVFMPLVRHARLPVVAALFVTGVLSGLWHGLGWTFVLWGLLQAAILVVLHFRASARDKAERPAGARRLFGIAATFLVSCLVGALFRAPTLEAARVIYGGLVGLPDAAAAQAARAAVAKTWFTEAFPHLGPGAGLALALAAFVAWIWPDPIRFFRRNWNATDPRPDSQARSEAAARPGWVEFDLTPAWAVGMAVLTLMVLLHLSEAKRFVYVQF